MLVQLELNWQPTGFKLQGRLSNGSSKRLANGAVPDGVQNGYRLKAKLKVPCPRSLKQDERSVSLFKHSTAH